MNERQAFLQALTSNEDDITTRLVFADWLDENGEHEEADRQRKWQTAKEWLVEFCRLHNPPPEDDSEMPISYEDLIESGKYALEDVEDGEFGFSCGNNMTMCDALRMNGEEFWQNWSIVTGIPLPPGAEGKFYFGCAC